MFKVLIDFKCWNWLEILINGLKIRKYLENLNCSEFDGQFDAPIFRKYVQYNFQWSGCGTCGTG